MVNTGILERRGNGQVTHADGKRTYPRDWHVVPIIGSVARDAVVIFLLGRPGSGKTTIARVLTTYLEEQGRTVVTFDDYHLLCAMAAVEKRLGKAMTAPAQFCHTMDGEQSGIKVLDFSVLELVLCQINRCVCQLLQPNTVILIEFARDEYLDKHVWQYFSHQVRTSAHYLYCDAELNVCIERVKQRPQHIATEVMTGYYSKDGLSSLFQCCKRERIEIVDTNGTLRATNMQVAHFLNRILAQPAFEAESDVSQEISRGYYRESNLVGQLESYKRSVRG